MTSYGIVRTRDGEDEWVRRGVTTVWVIRKLHALRQHWQADDCLIVARPSHGGWTRELVERYLGEPTFSCPLVLYVGLERNVDDDLDGVHYEVIEEAVGEDGEFVAQVFGPERLMSRFVQVDSPGVGQGWWRVGNLWGEKSLVNGNGAGFPWDEEALPPVREGRALQHEQLPNLLEQYLREPQEGRGPEGWVDPQGRFFETGYYGHDALIHGAFKVSVDRAEKIGFLRVQRDRVDQSHSFYSKVRHDGPITRAQRRALREIGVDPRDVAEV